MYVYKNVYVTDIYTLYIINVKINNPNSFKQF